MSVHGVTSAQRTLVSSLLQSVSGQLRPGRTSTKSSEPNSGPPFLLGGTSRENIPQVYDATGLLLSTTGAAGLAGGSSIQSTDEQETHKEALESAAASIKEGDLDEGRAQLDKLLAKNPSDTTALRFMGHSYMAEQNYQRAEQFYARASSIDPADARARGDLAGARALQESDDKVLAGVRRRGKSPTHRVEDLRLLFRLSARSPKSADVYIALADGFDAAGKPVQVVGALQEALRYADDEQIGEVVSRARKLTGEHSQVGFPHNILGRALTKAGQFSEAVRELATAVDLAPENLAYANDLAAAYVARARTKLDSGNAESAQSDLYLAQRISPSADGMDEVAAGVAVIRADRDVTAGLYNKALRRLRSVAANPPSDPRIKERLAAVYIRLGVHFEDQNEDTQALANFEQALSLDPNSSIARRNVGELSHSTGLAALSALNYDNAVRLLERAYETYRVDASYGQDLASAYDARGQWRVSLGELDDALDDFEKGVAADATNATLGAHFAAAVALNSSP